MRQSSYLNIILIILIFVIIPIVSAISYDRDITELPFTENNSWEIVGPNQSNYSIELACSRATTNLSNASCIYTIPSWWSRNFNGSVPTNITFLINISNTSNNGLSTEQYLLYINGTEQIDNFSIDFNFNVSVPEQNDSVPEPEPEPELANISITSISPKNNSVFGQFDIIPSEFVIKYTGQIDFEISGIEVWLNNSLLSTSIIKEEGLFKIKHNTLKDGIYKINMYLRDEAELQKNFSYSYTVKTTKPSKPISITPGRGVYYDGAVNLEVLMDDSNYTVYYMIYDGMPPIGGNWKIMNGIGKTYTYGIDLNAEGLGAIYVKIVDLFGNIRIYPTGIISGPRLEIAVEDRSKTVEPGDTIYLDMEIDIKKGSGNILKCKMTDFIANEGDDDEQLWSPRNTVVIRTEEWEEEDPDDDLELNIEKGYDETIILPEGTLQEDFEIELFIPRNVVINENYESELACIIS